MARVVRYIRDRLITIRSAPHTGYGVMNDSFGRYVFTFILGAGPTNDVDPRFENRDEITDAFDHFYFDFPVGR